MRKIFFAAWLVIFTSQETSFAADDIWPNVPGELRVEQAYREKLIELVTFLKGKNDNLLPVPCSNTLALDKSTRIQDVTPQKYVKGMLSTATMLNSKKRSVLYWDAITTYFTDPQASSSLYVYAGRKNDKGESLFVYYDMIRELHAQRRNIAIYENWAKEAEKLGANSETRYTTPLLFR